jgi:hypothetical protein
MSIDSEQEPGEQEPNEVEARAREDGWVPQDEFRGPEDQWRSAEEFVERGEEILEINAERANKRADKAEARTAELEKTVADFGGWRERVESQAYQRAVAQLEGQKRAAVEDGDTESFDAAARAQAEIPVPDARPATDPQVEQWYPQNEWYGGDLEMTEYADRIAGAVKTHRGGISGVALMDAVKAEVKTKFPDKFKNPRREAAPAVENGNGTAPRGREKGFASLPDSAKQTFTRFVKEGIFEDTKEDRAEYFGDYGDDA